MATDLVRLSATEAIGLLKKGEVSPLELIDAAEKRIGEVEKAVNALPTLCLDRARDHAKRLMNGEGREAEGEAGWLAGLPVAIKDLTDVAGVRTTYGSPIFKDHVPAKSHPLVERIERKGGVVIAKSNTPEFGAGGNTFNEVFGRTRNPWNPAMSAGGSTGGGAAALASGMIGLAEGTDMGGSLRLPASFCGVVGLRPSPGLVPTWPSPLQWDDLQVTGGMARTAEDIALMLDAVAGASPYSPIAQRTEGRRFLDAVRAGDGRGWRCAYSPDIGGAGVDPAVGRVCRAAALRLAGAGVIVEETGFSLAEFLRSFRDLRGLWMVAWQYDRLDRLDRFGDNTRNNVNYGLSLDVRRLAAAQKGRAAAWHKMRAFFEGHDFLLTPCVAVPPFPVELNHPPDIAGKPLETYVDWLIATFLVSITGLPAASAPAGLTGDGLPVGLQIVGPQFGEERVLTLAKLVQQTSPLPRAPLQ
jgi:amidase